MAHISPHRTSLNRSQIGVHALRLVDECGIEGFTIRALAQSMGVRSSSLYNHAASRDEFLDLAAETLMQSPEGPRIRLPTSRGTLSAWARSYVHVLAAHPALIPHIAQMQSRGVVLNDRSDDIIRNLESLGWGTSHATVVVQTLRAAVHASALAPPPDTGISVPQGEDEGEDEDAWRDAVTGLTRLPLVDAFLKDALPDSDSLARSQKAPTHSPADAEGPPRVEKARKTDLLQGLVHHLAEVGLSDVSFRSLAAAVGTNPSTLVYQFGSKNALLSEVAIEVEERQIRAASASTNGDLEGLHNYWNWTLRPENLKLLRLDFEICLLDAQSPGLYGEVSARLLQRWQKIWTKTFEDSGLDREMAAENATLLVDAIAGLQFDLVLQGDQERVTRAFEKLLTALDVGNDGSR